MPPAKFRAVTFDVGGTLIEPWPSVGDVYANIARRHGFGNPDPEILNHGFSCAWKARGEFDYTRDAWRRIVAESFHRLAMPVTDQFFNELFDFFATPGAWRVYEDVLPALEQLRSRQIRLAVISNWDTRLRPLLTRLKLDQYFETISCSYELGSAKPSREIFAKTLRQLELSPGEVLHVGDSRREDFDGAQDAGLHALWLRRERAQSSDRELATLSDLTDRVLK